MEEAVEYTIDMSLQPVGMSIIIAFMLSNNVKLLLCSVYFQLQIVVPYAFV